MMMVNCRIGNKQKDQNSAKVLSKSLQIRTKAELLLRQQLKSNYMLQNDKRNDILNLLSDYYSRIPFMSIIWNKYETKHCILDSIMLLNSKFNPYKARDAFKLVEDMLFNLVFLPWHHEFQKICTYSGQYRLSIQAPLAGVEKVLKAAGFCDDDECFILLPQDKMPQVDIDGESVSSVIFDVLLAQVVLSEIIDIFEDCYTNARRSHDREECSKLQEVNFSWIQAYIKERSHQTKEKACFEIQELLINIPNNFSKLAQSSSASSSSLEPSLKLKAVTNEAKESLKLSVQERTREFLAQQALEEENDLLRLPTNNGSRKSISDNLTSLKSIGRANNLDSIQQPTRPANGYNTSQQHQQTSSPLYSADSNFDQLSNVEHDVHYLHHQQHNEREPLIPKYDRKLITTQLQSQPKRSNFNEDNYHLNGAGHHVIGSGVSRHQISDYPYFSESSHQSEQTNHHHQNTRNLKYINKYDSHPESKMASRSYWTCESCTFDNQSSEICEMCRSKRFLK